jgi:hypothetical protein
MSFIGTNYLGSSKPIFTVYMLVPRKGWRSAEQIIPFSNMLLLVYIHNYVPILRFLWWRDFFVVNFRFWLVHISGALEFEFLLFCWVCTYRPVRRRGRTVSATSKKAKLWLPRAFLTLRCVNARKNASQTRRFCDFYSASSHGNSSAIVWVR